MALISFPRGLTLRSTLAADTGAKLRGTDNLHLESVTGSGWDIIINTKAQPSIEQVSELFFL